MKHYLFHKIYKLRYKLWDAGWLETAELVELILYSRFFEEEWKDLN